MSHGYSRTWNIQGPWSSKLRTYKWGKWHYKVGHLCRVVGRFINEKYWWLRPSAPEWRQITIRGRENMKILEMTQVINLIVHSSARLFITYRKMMQGWMRNWNTVFQNLANCFQSFKYMLKTTLRKVFQRFFPCAKALWNESRPDFNSIWNYIECTYWKMKPH